MRLSILILSWTAFAFCARAAELQSSPIDREIAFWETRQSKQPQDVATLQNLSKAYLEKARDGGPFTLVLKAAAGFESALKMKPRDPVTLNGLARAYIQQYRFKEALTLAENAAKVLPDDGFSYGLQGDCWAELGDLDKAESCWLRSMEISADTFALSRWARMQFLRGDLPAALKFSSEALHDAEAKSQPSAEIARCRLQLGQLYFQTGKFDAAEEFYQQALKDAPDSAGPLDYLAELRGAQERYDDAIELYQQALALAPRPELYQAFGDLLVLAQKPERSDELLNKASELYIAEINQGNAGYLHHLAGFYSDSKKSPADAVRWARRDCELRQSIYAHDCLAWALFTNGDFAEARVEMKKALAAGTQDAHFYNHASQIFFRAGDVEASRAAVRKAALLNPRYNTFHAHRY